MTQIKTIPSQAVKPDFEQWALIKKEFEGCKLVAYKDSGKVWTIGLGTTYLFDKKRKVREGDTITMNQAIYYMEHDTQEVVRLANTYIKKVLNAWQSTAICDYIYNRGIGTFLSTAIDDCINVDAEDPGIAKLIEATGWKDRLGITRRGLIRRRKCQALLYRNKALKFYF